MSLLSIQHLQHQNANLRELHRHAQGQLLLVHQGVVSIDVENGRWIIPTESIGWVPPHCVHGAYMHGPMRGLSLYFAEQWSQQSMPDTLTLVKATPLLKALIERFAHQNIIETPINEHYLAVFACEYHLALQGSTQETMFLPMPKNAKLLHMATDLLESPDDATSLDGWGQRIGMSRRHLTRKFKEETGWSFIQWRQQMRLMHAVERLASGKSVTTVSLEMGFTSVSHFIALFKRAFGTSPKNYSSSPPA